LHSPFFDDPPDFPTAIRFCDRQVEISVARRQFMSSR
jgi:hypothetical protein